MTDATNAADTADTSTPSSPNSPSAPITIAAFCGSLRAGSVNAATMRAAMNNAPDGVTFAPIDVRAVPLYNGDVEDAGLPDAVQSLHDAVAAADGLMIFTPEYNGSYPAVTKNVIDWISRPPHPWLGKGLTMVVTTPGGMAGKYFRDHFDAVLGSGYFTFKHHPAMGIGTYGDKLDDAGEMVDADTIAALTAFVAAFADRCREPMPDER